MNIRDIELITYHEALARNLGFPSSVHSPAKIPEAVLSVTGNEFFVDIPLTSLSIECVAEALNCAAQHLTHLKTKK